MSLENIAFRYRDYISSLFFRKRNQYARLDYNVKQSYRDSGISKNNEEFWREYTLEKHNQLNYSRLEYLLFVSAGSILGYVINKLLGNPDPDPSTLDQILINAKYIWLAYTPIATLSAIGILKYNPKKDFYLERRKQSEDYKVIFQITTRGFNTDAVQRGVKSVLYWAPKYLSNYEIWIVTEDDVDKNFFESLKEINEEARKRVRVVYVPRDYKTPNNTKYKARALHYAMELRKELEYDSKKTWIYLMDEESIVGEDTVLGIIDFIENESKKGKLIGQGLIVYSNFWGKNLLTSLEDSLRAADDITRFKLHARYGHPIFGLHGSHMLYRFDLELNVTWDVGKESYAEDALFALELIRKYPRGVLGWLRGKSYEQSPFSIWEFLKQRRRWYWGVLHMLLNKKNIPFKYKLSKTISILSWTAALPSIMITYANILHATPTNHSILAGIFGFSLTTLIYLYWEGAKLNLGAINKKSIWKKMLNIIAIPIIAPLEGIAALYGLITYFTLKKKDYDIVRK